MESRGSSCSPLSLSRSTCAIDQRGTFGGFAHFVAALKVDLKLLRAWNHDDFHLCARNFALEPEALKQESNLLLWSSWEDQNSLVKNTTSFDHGPDWGARRRAQIDDFAWTGNAISDLEVLAGGD